VISVGAEQPKGNKIFICFPKRGNGFLQLTFFWNLRWFEGPKETFLYFLFTYNLAFARPELGGQVRSEAELGNEGTAT